MAESQRDHGVSLEEGKIPGAKLVKNIDNMSRAEAERWLKCRTAMHLSQLSLKDLKTSKFKLRNFLVLQMLR